MVLGVRLPEQLEHRLTDLARVTHRSKTHYVIEALEGFLEANEETLKTIARYEEQRRNGTLKTHSLEDVMKELGIEQKNLDAAILD